MKFWIFNFVGFEWFIMMIWIFFLGGGWGGGFGLASSVFLGEGGRGGLFVGVV